MPSGKSLSPEENEKLRLLLSAQVHKYGSQKGFALAAKTSQQMVSHVMNGGGAGVHWATKIAHFLKFKSYVEMLGDDALPRYGDDPSWKENEAEALAAHPFPEYVVNLARETPAYLRLDYYTPSAIVATILWRWAMTSEEDRIRLATEQASSDATDAQARRRFRREPPSSPKLPPVRRIP